MREEILRERMAMIRRALHAQADDKTIWLPLRGTSGTIGEAYLQQSLRWLHRVIEDGDEAALASIIEQAEDRI